MLAGGLPITPEVCVSKSRTVGARPVLLTFLNSARYFSMGSERDTSPSSTSIMMPTAVIGLVIDMI